MDSAARLWLETRPRCMALQGLDRLSHIKRLCGIGSSVLKQNAFEQTRLALAMDSENRIKLGGVVLQGSVM